MNLCQISSVTNNESLVNSSNMANKCKECGCVCNRCVSSDHDVHLHVEIEHLKHKLVERENHIVTMETTFLNEANKFPNGELAALGDELLMWQDKYSRLYEAHRRVQRVNQGLEDKLLKLVDVSETDKSTLTKDVATLSHKLAEVNYIVKKLTNDNERYKNDVSLAIQFLQCKQSNFVAHKFDSLPQEVQAQVSSYMTNKKKPEERRVAYEMKSIKVPIPTFPPTAMVYSVPKSPKPDRRIPEEEPETPPVDIVSAAIMAKVLEERQKERAFAKHCDTCTCSKKLKIVYETAHHTIGTQTTGESKSNVCLSCKDAAARIVSEPTNKNVAAYTSESSLLEGAQVVNNGNNVVKVQPNNFLTDQNTSSTVSNIHSSNNNIDNSNLLNDNELKSRPDVNFFSVNENKKSPRLGAKVEHHHLCDKAPPNFEDKSESDATSAKYGSSENLNLKGPRYCSLRLQSGTRNILLDNAHNNIPPVLYTRHHKLKRGETPSPHPGTAQTESSEDLKNVSIVSDNSAQYQQRVADWVRSNLDNTEVSSSDNSQSEPLVGGCKFSLNRADRIKYTEMEENVKRFLFGESEFLKTVEIGKLKYQSYREDSTGQDENNDRAGSNSHTETHI